MNRRILPKCGLIEATGKVAVQSQAGRRRFRLPAKEGRPKARLLCFAIRHRLRDAERARLGYKLAHFRDALGQGYRHLRPK
jgi:hypothetical protein